MSRVVISPRMGGEPAEKFCSKCSKFKPIENFRLTTKWSRKGEQYYYRNAMCRECVSANMAKRYRTKAKATEFRSKIPSDVVSVRRKDVSCRENCEFYPCFKGIDTMKSNLALTCVNFKEK